MQISVKELQGSYRVLMASTTGDPHGQLPKRMYSDVLITKLNETTFNCETVFRVEGRSPEGFDIVFTTPLLESAIRTFNSW